MLVRDGDQLLKAHWSIRQQRFFDGAYGHVPTCDPRTDYAATLAEGRVEPERLAVGPHTYVVPPELDPVADIASLSVRSTMLTDRKQTYPAMSERIKIDFAAPDLFVPRDAKPLTEVPLHQKIEPAELTRGKSLRFSGTDPSTGRTVVLDCLRGAYADRNCHATVKDGPATYSFFLPWEKLQDWADACSQVTNLFDRLRAPEN